MRKIIVNNIQTPTGTAFTPFESTSTGEVVFKDPADGVFKDIEFPADIKKYRNRETGTSGQYINIPLQDSNGNVTEGLELNLIYNRENALTDPAESTKRIIKLYVKDSNNNVLSPTNTQSRANAVYTNWNNSLDHDSTTRSFISIKDGDRVVSSDSTRNHWRNCTISFYQDESSHWYFQILYEGCQAGSLESSQTIYVYGMSFAEYETGTPHTLVIETNATVGNMEQALSVWDRTGSL